ncbi:hypothetical protein FKP32DRAFT_1682307 [Trametes sanguinea]|nr:hypothetical protein FKP32DRAFT_1682307 [Trametes sanguinea]
MANTSDTQVPTIILDEEPSILPWTKITAETVFKNSDPTSSNDLRRDIALLSTALNQRKFGPSTGANVSAGDEAHSADKALLGHISSLLTTGHAGDLNAATVNAVIGRFDAQGGVVSLVCSDNEKMEAAVKAPELLGCAISKDRGKKLLEGWDTDLTSQDKYSFKSHVEDIGSILAYIWRHDLKYEDRIADAKLRASLDCFMIRRAHWKMSGRLRNARVLWGKLPLSIMRKWYKSHPESIKAATVEFSRMRAGFAQFLDTHSLLPQAVDDSKRAIYPLSPENIDNWLDALESLVARLHVALHADGRVKAAPSAKATLEIYSDLLNLNDLLRSSLFARITTEGVCNELQSWYEDPKKSERAQQDNDAESAKDSQGQPSKGGSDEDVVVEMGLDDASFETEDGENRVLHVRRYLQTITAWLNASGALVPTDILVKTVDVSVLRTAPRLDVEAAHITGFLDEYRSQLKEQLKGSEALPRCEAAFEEGPINQLRNRNKPGDISRTLARLSVHAETALMGLSWVCIQGIKDAALDYAKVKHLFPQDGEVVIGVSKKCCWCCYSLQSLLRKHNSDPSVRPVSFILPGSHATIYSWIPPPETPLEVLKTMRESLFVALNHSIFQPAAQLFTNQSSPVASGTSYPSLLDDALEELGKERGDGQKQVQAKNDQG